MNSETPETKTRNFAKIIQQFFLGLVGGLLLIGIPFSYIWIFPNNSPVSPLQITILIAGSILPGICSAIWGDKFIDRLIKILESAPPV
jgi:hypothetical protein